MALEACIDLEVNFSIGNSGHARELLYTPSAHGTKTVVGAKSHNGSICELQLHSYMYLASTKVDFY